MKIDEFPKRCLAIRLHRLLEWIYEFHMGLTASWRNWGSALCSKSLWCCRPRCIELTFNCKVVCSKCHLVFICRGPFENGRLDSVTSCLPPSPEVLSLFNSEENVKFMLWHNLYLCRTLKLTKRFSCTSSGLIVLCREKSPFNLG